MSLFDRIFGKKPPLPASKRAFAQSEEGKRKLAELDAIIAKNNASVSVRLGKLPADWPASAFPADRHASGKGAETSPFGEEILKPKSRTIPEAYAGAWRAANGERLIISPVTLEASYGPEPIIAVRTIDKTGIAVISQMMGESGWEYALRYLGLSPDGATLTDLESADITYVRS